MSDAATEEKTTTLDLDKLADKLRGRVDLFGKALAAIATLGTGAVGLAKVADLSPWEDGEGRWVAVAVGCLMASAVAGIYVSVRLMGVSTPVVLEPSVDTSALDTSKLGSARADVATIFKEAAQRYGFTSLLALQEHATSLRRAAARATTTDQQARRGARATEVETEIERALARARLAVVRRSATEAVTGHGAWISYLVAIVGLMGFALAADSVTSDPAAQIATAKSCGEARSAGALTAELPDACQTPSMAAGTSATPTATPGPAQQRAQLVASLSALLTTCTDQAATSATPSPAGAITTEDCDAIAGVMRFLLGP